MIDSLKRLAQETALYGLPSIIGRFLNWLLVPLYVRVLSGTDQFGIYTHIYGWTALLLILLTCGMETAFFRFVNKQEERHPLRVYATAFTFVTGLSVLFAALGLSFGHRISMALGFGEHPDYLRLMVLVVALDAVGAIPFAWLRYRQRALHFAILRLISIALNIGLNLFFFIGCPLLESTGLTVPGYNPDYGVGYVFLANLITTLVTTLLLFPQILPVFRHKPDFFLLRHMLGYAFPILLLGIAGICNQTADKILFPFLFTDKLYAARELGIYGACFKMAAVMVMFTQAFRYAYEPFIFARHRQEGSRLAYVETMRYFILAGLFIFLLLTFYIDVWKHFITPDYYSGLRVIPIVLAGEIFFGIYFNLSLWYKLSDQTYWGAVFSAIGCGITVVMIVTLAPAYGYMACAWASLISNFVMMALSYIVGQRRFPVSYDLRSAIGAMAVTATFYGAAHLPVLGESLVYRTFLLLIFAIIVYRNNTNHGKEKRKSH
jgi:O-antigen/teichoic acid export membrane protein